MKDLKIEKIETNKIKVTLSALDLIDMNISVKSLTPDSPVLHGFLHDVMEMVKAETGFNPYSGQVMVEAVPSGDGIVLMVTKIAEKKKPKKVRVAGHRSASKITYRFGYFENICRLFEISDPNRFENAGLYEYMDNFYIVIGKDKTAGMSEFGDARGNVTLSESFLKEHAKLHAMGKDLVAMAEGVKKLAEKNN